MWYDKVKWQTSLQGWTTVPVEECQTSLPKVIWGEGHVTALLHMYDVKSRIGYNDVPQIRPQKYPFPWTDPQTPLPASCLDQSDLWCQTASGSDPPFSTMHWTDQPMHVRTRTNAQTTDHPRESLMTIGRWTRVKKWSLGEVQNTGHFSTRTVQPKWWRYVLSKHNTQR